MIDKSECSECGSFHTKRVHLEWYSDTVEEIRVCQECPTQFTNKFELFEKVTDETEAVEA